MSFRDYGVVGVACGCDARSRRVRTGKDVAARIVASSAVGMREAEHCLPEVVEHARAAGGGFYARGGVGIGGCVGRAHPYEKRDVEVSVEPFGGALPLTVF